MTAIAIATIDNDGADPGLRAAAAGDWVVPGSADRVALWIENGSGSAVTVTLTTFGNIYGQPIPDVPVVVGAGLRRAVKIERAWADPVTGQVAVSYSATTSVSVAGVTIG